MNIFHLVWIIPLTIFLTVFCLSLGYAASDFENYKTDEKEELIDEQRNDMEESEK